MHPTGRSTTARFLALGAAAALLAAACSSGSNASAQNIAGATNTPAPVIAATAAPTQTPENAAPVATSTKTLQLAYLSFAVANSYDAPMLAAARAAASAGNAQLTVFDANNDPATQTKQLQDAVASGKYDGIVLQPIYGAGLVTDVKNAIAKGVPVGNIDQILGADFTTANSQIDGLSANVVFVPSEMGTKMGELTVQACQAKNANPCKVGYVYSVKASGLDGALYTAFTAAIAKGTNIQVVAQGESFYQVALGLKASQDMLTAHPNMDVIVGSDQSITGALQAVTAAKLKGKVQLVGYGGAAIALQGIASGDRFGTVMQAPAAEGQVGVENLIKAIRTGKAVPGVDILSSFADGGVVTKSNVANFINLADWPG